MVKLKRLKPITHLLVGLCAISVVTACSGSGSTDSEVQEPFADATISGIGNGPISEDFIEFTPNIGGSIDIDYANTDIAESATDEYIIEQWVHMQTCLQVSAQEPIVTVVDGTITPLATTDDVIRHIDGQIQASANVTDTAANIQIRAEDFDGSLGDPGSYLRSIMGRYLWLANSLAERDYPYSCARLN